MIPTIHRKIGHTVAQANFRRTADSDLTCVCGAVCQGPTPEHADLEWQAHRRAVKAGEGRPNLRVDDGASFNTFSESFR